MIMIPSCQEILYHDFENSEILRILAYVGIVIMIDLKLKKYYTEDKI